MISMNLCVCVLLFLFDSIKPLDANHTNTIAYSSSPTSFSYAKSKSRQQHYERFSAAAASSGIPAWSTFLEFVTEKQSISADQTTWTESPTTAGTKPPEKLIKRLTSNRTTASARSQKLYEILILVHEDSLKHSHCTFSSSADFLQNGSRKASSSSSSHSKHHSHQHIHHRQNFEYYLCNYLNDMVLLKASNHLKDRSLCKYDNKKPSLIDDCVTNNDDHYSSMYNDHFRLVSLKINSSFANPDNVNRLYQQIKSVYFGKKPTTPKSSSGLELERVLRSIFLIADS